MHIRNRFHPYCSTRPRGYEEFTSDRSEFGKSLLEQVPACDIINLHWVSGFLDYGAFLGNIAGLPPVVWRLSDLNPFTGGCHYDAGCGRYNTGCGACPQLGSDESNDLSAQVWKRKERVFDQMPPERLHTVAQSRWMAGKIRDSVLFGRFPVTRIPNGLDLDVFSPREARIARAALEIPMEANVILFVADWAPNMRKGLFLLSQALKRLDACFKPFLLSLGKGEPEIEGSFSRLHLGYQSHDRLLALAYSAADLFVIPSLQDNLPNTVLESLACGTPVVGFDTGGIPDMVRPGITGLLAPVGNVDALCEAIARLLDDPSARAHMSENCRRIAVEEYSLQLQARRYVELYSQVLDQ
jgi:glycosyltransferase involved in cell wall biosynthesis